MKNILLLRSWIVLLVIFVLAWSLPSAAQDDNTAAMPYHVVGSMSANVRVAPRLDAAILQSLAPGSDVMVTGSLEGEAFVGSTLWYAVSVAQGQGYVHSSLLSAGESAAPAIETDDTAVEPEPTSSPPTASIPPGRTANPNALPKAQEILRYFYDLPQREDNRVVSGQFGAYGRDTGADTAERQLQRIFDATGKMPALTGMDYAQWDLNRENDFTEPNDFMIQQWEMGSLINVSWHAPNPWTGGASTDWENPDTGDAYDTRDVMALVTPGNAAHDQWMRLLDNVAEGLSQLQDAGVIVIWRPLHEMNGGWAWWQRQKPESYVALWQQMFDYFTYEKGLNNLLWAYSPNVNGTEYDYGSMYFYPGDAYVDFVGLDKYMAIGEDPLSLNRFSEYDDLLTAGKPIGLFEFGPIPATGAGWDTVKYDYEHLIRDIRAYYPKIVLFQAWEYVWQIGNHENAAGLFADPWVITRDELPDW